MVLSTKTAVGLSAAVTATGAGLILSRRWSKSEGAAATHSDAPSTPDSDREDWHLADYLHAASERTADTAQSLKHVLRSARHAWEQRKAAVAAGAAAEAASAKPGPAALAADFLAELNEAQTPNPGRSLQLINTRFADYLLDKAAAPDADPADQAAALRFLSAVLRSQSAAEALLQHPGVVPRLLALSSTSPSLQPLLAQAIACAAPPMEVLSDDIDAVLHLTAAEQRGSAKQHPAAASESRQLRLCLQLLLHWAAGSADNASSLADAGAGGLLADLAAMSAVGEGVDGLQGLIAQLMGVLATSASQPSQLHMQRWLYHLLCFAADASAGRQWELADAALHSLAACLLRGCELPAQLMTRSTLPLLRQLAEQPEQEVRPAVALTVQALAQGPGVQLPLSERERWAEMLLQWLAQPPGPAAQELRPGSTPGGSTGGISGRKRRRQDSERNGERKPGNGAELQRRVAAALLALSCPAGSEGLHVAHAWLAELIVRLSHQVRPLPLEPPAKPAAQPSGASSAGGGSRWWWPFGGSNGSRVVEHAAGRELPTAQRTGATTHAAAALEEAQAEASVRQQAAEGPYLPLPPSEQADAAAAAAAAAGGWWKVGWWPWGGLGGQTGAQPGAEQAASKPSDSELALVINAAPVGPVYARSVAAALLEASGRVGSFQEPPADAEELMGPEAVAVYPQVAAAIDWDMADAAVCQALKVLCALASGGGPRRAWLLESGALPLLRRLTFERPRDVAELPPIAGQHVDPAPPLCTQRQAVRLLAMLAADLAGAEAVQDAGHWIPWLQELAVSSDLKLSSCASRALLHIESAAATQRGCANLAQLAEAARSEPLLLPPAPDQPHSQGLPPGNTSRHAASEEGGTGQNSGTVEALLRSAGTEVKEAAKEAAREALGEARAALVHAVRRLDRSLDPVRPPVPPEERLVLQDGVHLFDPLAPHHELLAREGVGAHTPDAPLMDVVFVHGIRGGAFATWRREGVLERGQARESLDRSVCWPACWVARELPEARLLSLEYAAPASGWEGESLPFQHIVAQLMEKLAAAGVGQRPVVFVCHSMGGLVIKDLLVTAKQQRDERLQRLATSATGAVFYSVPHAGSRLADWGWYLRFVGGAPAKHVLHLKTGTQQEELNAAIRKLCKSGRLAVLSFSEGRPTKLGVIPTHVVPLESAYPGYGEFVVLHSHDHISVCKPTDKDDPAYARLMAFLRARVGELRAQRAAAATNLDHMETSVL